VYVAGVGSPDLPFTDAAGSKLYDYWAVTGYHAGSGKVLVYTLNVDEPGLYEADPTTGSWERLLVARMPGMSGLSFSQTGQVFAMAVGTAKVALTSYVTHDLRLYDHRTAEATWSNVATFSAGTTLRRVHAQGFVLDKVEVAYRLDAGPWVVVMPSSAASLGVDVSGKVVDVRVRLNTWRGFGSGVYAPLDKTAPVVTPIVEYEQPDPAPQPVLCGPPVRLRGGLRLDTAAGSRVRLVTR
jgi:hypothetical protein